MKVGEQALRAAGLALAHALWSVSDLEDGALCPLAIVGDGETHLRLFRFEAPTQEQAIARAKREMAQVQGTPWAFARDGIIREGEERVDILVGGLLGARNGRAGHCDAEIRAARGTTGRFRLRGAIEVVIDGRVVREAAAARAIELVREGMFSHNSVAELLPEWQ